MAGCSDVCCCGVKPCCQCGKGNRKIFYNYDRTRSVEPLVDYFTPTNTIARRNLIKGMSLDSTVLKKGLTAVEQIAAVINFAHQHDLQVRAVGSGCSWSTLTTVRDILVDMTNLNQILKAEPQNEDGSVYHIEVQGGMKVYDFIRVIDSKYHMGLPTLGIYDGQTIAGIISTSTHGEGHDFQTLSNSVVELHMVIARGIEVKVRAAKDDEIDEDFESVERRIMGAKYGDPPVQICSTDIFRAVAVGLGSLGVVYSVTLECIPVYNIKQTRHFIELDWSPDEHLVKTPQEFKRYESGALEYQSILINPFQHSQKATLSGVFFSGERTEETGGCGCDGCGNPGCQCCTCREFKDGTVQIDCVYTCIHKVINCFPSLPPWVVDNGLKCLVQPTYIRKWYNALVYFTGTLHFKDAEICIPFSEVDNALGDIVGIMQAYQELYNSYTLIPILVRTVKADDLYLSPANRRRPNGEEVDHYCYIDVPFPFGAYGSDELQQKIEDHLFTHYQGRPHWGKNNFLSKSKVKKLYPDLHRWKRVYCLFNRDGTFDNEFTSVVGFEDWRHHERGPENMQAIISSSSVMRINTHAHYHHQHHHHHAGWDQKHDNEGQSGRRHLDVVCSQPKKSAGVLPPTLYEGKKHFTPIPIHR